MKPIGAILTILVMSAAWPCFAGYDTMKEELAAYRRCLMPAKKRRSLRLQIRPKTVRSSRPSNRPMKKPSMTGTLLP